MSSRTWREDSVPLRGMIDQFAQLDDDKNPELRTRKREQDRAEAERQIIEATPRSKRPAVRLLLRLARKRLIYRGMAKESFLQAFDICRACARRIGASLAEAGKLEDPEDAFYLTASELTGELPADAQEIVALRRDRRAAYQGVELPTQWTGVPELISAAEAAEAAAAGGDGDVNGIGVSSGVFEGPAVVVMSPDTEIDPDQVLVAPTTDPSWTSIMFISSALVVDIGGALSHAAVVARELGIPCVVNTRTGTKSLQSGDRIRVDGGKGTVEILEKHSA